MRIINGLKEKKLINAPVAATIGNFDGVHLGHQAILENLQLVAKKMQLPSMLITFEPSPQEFFLKDNAPPRLTRLHEKLRLLETMCLDYVVILPFNKALSMRSAEYFAKQILQDDLQIQYLLVGDDFHFGKNRLGNFALLQSLADNEKFMVASMPTIRLHGERISSSRIRSALESGDLETAERLLGRPYSMLGTVVEGQKRGRTIGFPTANIFLERHRSPVLGVYAVKVYGLKKTIIQGVANIGNRPTVDGTRSLLEVHLFDFNRDIYGEGIQVEFCHKIRNEKRFANFSLLEQQISQDVIVAKKFFADRN